MKCAFLFVACKRKAGEKRMRKSKQIRPFLFRFFFFLNSIPLPFDMWNEFHLYSRYLSTNYIRPKETNKSQSTAAAAAAALQCVFTKHLIAHAVWFLFPFHMISSGFRFCFWIKQKPITHSTYRVCHLSLAYNPSSIRYSFSVLWHAFCLIFSFRLLD